MGERSRIMKPISGYNGIYSISEKGDIYRHSCLVIFGVLSCKWIKGHFLKPCKNSRGYMQIKLYKDGISAILSIHRLLANSYLKTMVGKDFVNHKNGIKNDNRLENLEWVSSSDNAIHAYRKKLWKSKITDQDAIDIRRLYSMKELSTYELSKKYNLSRRYIQQIVSGKRKQHINNPIGRED